MRKPSFIRLLCISFLCFISHLAFSQTIYNIYGKVGSYIENNVFFDFDGTPLMHVSNENVYMFDGKHIGFYVEGIFYNREGLIVGFRKGAVNMPTEPDPPKGPRAPLPPKAPLEPAPPRPPLQPKLATIYSGQSNSVGQTNSSTSTNVNSSTSKPVTGNDILSYKGNAALAGVSDGGSIDNTEMNNAVSNLAYSTMEYNKYKLQLGYKAKPYFDAAWRYYNDNDLSNAEFNAKQAIIIAGNFHFGANYLLGLIYRDKENFQLAIQYLDLAIKQYKKDGDYYAVRGFCYYKLDNKKQAQKDFKTGKKKGSKAATNYLTSLSL